MSQAAPRFVLVSNDDGPPNEHDSPFVKPFVRALDEIAQWPRGVCLPSQQQSWIGKAHRPKDTVVHTTYENNDTDKWNLLSTTPAGCVNIALHNVYADKNIDLVISGANNGRNTGTIFSAASGTIGAALEAALCGVRAVAVSFAYYRDHPFTDADVSIASKTAVKVIQELWAHWPEGVELFSINVPLYGGILESPKVYTTHFNRARCRSLFAPSPTTPSTFAFKPDYPGMFKSGPEFGSDAWAINHRHVSVTPMVATWAMMLEANVVFPKPSTIARVLPDVSETTQDQPQAQEGDASSPEADLGTMADG